MTAEEAPIAARLVQSDDPTAIRPPSTSEAIRGRSYPADGFTAVSHLVEPRFHAQAAWERFSSHGSKSLTGPSL